MHSVLWDFSSKPSFSWPSRPRGSRGHEELKKHKRRLPWSWASSETKSKTWTSKLYLCQLLWWRTSADDWGRLVPRACGYFYSFHSTNENREGWKDEVHSPRSLTSPLRDCTAGISTQIKWLEVISEHHCSRRPTHQYQAQYPWEQLGRGLHTAQLKDRFILT